MLNGNPAHRFKFASSVNGTIMSRLFLFGLILTYAAIIQSSAKAQEINTPAGIANMALPLQKSREAIEECRERRLQKELFTYKESAECSSPKIFAAWQDAKYPHMDLITVWLNARESASQKVDEKTITPAQFDRQMTDLTNRMTITERRRRAGLSDSPANEVVAQPSAQVAAVTTPARNERMVESSRRPKETSTSRRTVAAVSQPGEIDTLSLRTAATSAQPAPIDTQSIGLLSKLETRWDVPAHLAPVGGRTQSARPSRQNRDSDAGVGGPFVPVAAASGSSGRIGQLQPTSVSYSSSPAVGRGTGIYVQLSSQRSEAEAQAAFGSLQNQYPNILGNKQAVIRRADLGSKGTYYRAQIGPVSAEKADRVCSKLKAAGGECFLQYN